MKPISVFYHLFIPDTSGMWIWWVDEQLGLLKTSGLAENATINMCITMLTGLVGKMKVHDKIKPPKEVEICFDKTILDYINQRYPFVNIIGIRGSQEQPNLFEGYTLKHLYDYSLKNDGYVMYFHNKGITESFYNTNGVFGEDKKWRQYMQHHCVNRWKECVAKLDEGYDCVGPNYFKDFYPFAGNFWWASTKHITRLDDPLDVEKYYTCLDKEKYGWDGFVNSYRFAFELWIGSKKDTIDIKHYYIDVRNITIADYVNNVKSSMIKKEEIITPKTDINLNNYMTQPKNQKFNLVRIVPDNHFSIHSSVFHEIEASVFFALQRMGCEVSNTVNEFKTDARNIVFGMHHCPVDVVRHDIPKDTIIYSLEQMRDAPECIRWCRKYRGLEVWDYSMRNVEVLRKAGVENIKHCKIGYVPELSYFERNRPEDRDIDILAYMYVSERRNKILEQFSNDKNINFVHIQSVYGDDRDAYIKRAKLVINIHNHENQIFEMVRVSHAIQNKIPVLAERNPTTDFPSYMEGTIYTTPYDNFVSKAYELIKNPAQMDRDAEKALEIFKKSPMENFLKEVLQ